MTSTTLWHEKTIQDLVSLQGSDQNILAMILFGSAAQTEEEVDEWSDLDILLVIEDGSIDQYYPAVDWLHQFGSIFTHDHSQNEFTKTSRVVFSDLRRLDFVLTSSSSFAMIEEWPQNPLLAGYHMLYSNENRIDEAVEKMTGGSRRELTKSDDFRIMVDKFWFKGTLAVYKVARNDLLIALHLALDMVRDCCVLAMMLRDREEGVSHHKTGGVGNEYVSKLSSSEQPYTARGILAMIESCGETFDDLASAWSDQYLAKRYPLLEMIALARKEIAGAT